MKHLLLFLLPLVPGAHPRAYLGGQGFNPGTSYAADQPTSYFGGSGSYAPGGLFGGQGFHPAAEGREEAQGTACYNPVAFSAVRVEEYSRFTPGRVRFERTLSNIGGGWDGSRGEFIAPYSGTYSISWTALSPASSHLRLGLLLNGQEQAASWAESDGYQTAAGTLNLNLRLGDRLSLELAEGGIYEPVTSSRGYSIFSAHRIG